MMEAKDYSAAEVYLNNVSAYVKEKYMEESYQIESLRARLLLEKTMYDKDEKMHLAILRKHTNLYVQIKLQRDIILIGRLLCKLL